VICEHLGEGQDGFDGEAEVADQVGVGGLSGGAEEYVEGEEKDGEEEEGLPVAGGGFGC